jgi:hypothetical protein
MDYGPCLVTTPLRGGTQSYDWPKPPLQGRCASAVHAFTALRAAKSLAVRGTIDLIFSREPASPGQIAKPFQIFNGQRLVPIAEYLKLNSRPDLIDLDRRMQRLGAGPFGHHAGDIVLLSKACTQVPIEQRFYFASVSHHTWHGSACAQDSQIPFILAQAGGSGERMRNLLRKFGGDTPTQLMMTPLVRELLK